MTRSVEQLFQDQLEYARELAQIWKCLTLEECAEQIEAHVESEFGFVLPAVVGEALYEEGLL